eukprot:jgi/Mesen1/2822/ME000172S01972
MALLRAAYCSLSSRLPHGASLSLPHGMQPTLPPGACHHSQAVRFVLGRGGLKRGGRKLSAKLVLTGGTIQTSRCPLPCPAAAAAHAHFGRKSQASRRPPLGSPACSSYSCSTPGLRSQRLRLNPTPGRYSHCSSLALEGGGKGQETSGSPWELHARGHASEAATWQKEGEDRKQLDRWQKVAGASVWWEDELDSDSDADEDDEERGGHADDDGWQQEKAAGGKKRRTKGMKKEEGNTRQRGAKRAVQWEARGRYKGRFSDALKAELDAEMSALQERFKWPREKLQKEGYALFDMRPRLDSRIYKDRLVRFVGTGPEGLLPPANQFSQGDMVAISRHGPIEDGDSVIEGILRANILNCDPDSHDRADNVHAAADIVFARAHAHAPPWFIRVAVAATAISELDLSRQYRLDLTANRIAYERAVQAVELLAALPRGWEPFLIRRRDDLTTAAGPGFAKLHESSLERAYRAGGPMKASGQKKSAAAGQAKEKRAGGGGRGRGGAANSDEGPGLRVGEAGMIVKGLIIGLEEELAGGGQVAYAEDRGGQETSAADALLAKGAAGMLLPAVSGQFNPELAAILNSPASVEAGMKKAKHVLAATGVNGKGSKKARAAAAAAVAGDIKNAHLSLHEYGKYIFNNTKSISTYDAFASVSGSASGRADGNVSGSSGSFNSAGLARRLPAVAAEGLAFAGKEPTWGKDKGQGHGGMHRAGVKATLKKFEGQLNASQLAAVEAAMCRRVTLWQGPPGTGKTRTLLRFILAAKMSGAGKILACADSNVAVDNLLEGLLDLGVKVVRIGHPVKVKESLREATLEAQVAQHPLTQRAAQMRQVAIEERQASRAINNPKKRMAAAKEAVKAWDRALDVEAIAVKEILDRADVVTATCVGAGDPLLEGCRFSICVIDEATQATEPAALIPIFRSSAGSVVLVGDPAQLPPTVVSHEALQLGLPTSLFERLQTAGIKPYLLDTQYRMHPAIAAFPAHAFYGGRLLSFPKPANRPAPLGFKWPVESKPLAFMDCAEGREQTTASEGRSLFNRLEASLVVHVVRELLADDDIEGGVTGVGIISPYNAQVRLLQDLFRAAEISGGGSYDALEIKSVDGFQGREKEVIVLSTVRSNPEGRLGFVMDPRRMNVALTRAKRGLIVIGSLRTLCQDPQWNAWLKHMHKGGLLIHIS